MNDFETERIFSKEKEKTTKKKKKVFRVAGRGKNARLFRQTFRKSRLKNYPNGKKTGTLAMALQFYGAVGTVGRPAKFEFLLGLSYWKPTNVN